MIFVEAMDPLATTKAPSEPVSISQILAGVPKNPNRSGKRKLGIARTCEKFVSERLQQKEAKIRTTKIGSIPNVLVLAFVLSRVKK